MKADRPDRAAAAARRPAGRCASCVGARARARRDAVPRRRGGGASTASATRPASRSARSASDVDLCLVLGGDGTILGALREYAGTDVPVFAVNFGEVGFLATIDPDGPARGLRARARGRVRDDGACRRSPSGARTARWTAFNDISVHRRPGQRVADLAYAHRRRGDRPRALRRARRLHPGRAPRATTSPTAARCWPGAWRATSCPSSRRTRSPRGRWSSRPDDPLTINNASREDDAEVHVDGRPACTLPARQDLTVEFGALPRRSWPSCRARVLPPPARAVRPARPLSGDSGRWYSGAPFDGSAGRSDRLPGLEETHEAPHRHRWRWPQPRRCCALPGDRVGAQRLRRSYAGATRHDAAEAPRRRPQLNAIPAGQVSEGPQAATAVRYLEPAAAHTVVGPGQGRRGPAHGSPDPAATARPTRRLDAPHGSPFFFNGLPKLRCTSAATSSRPAGGTRTVDDGQDPQAPASFAPPDSPQRAAGATRSSSRQAGTYDVLCLLHPGMEQTRDRAQEEGQGRVDQPRGRQDRRGREAGRRGSFKEAGKAAAEDGPERYGDGARRRWSPSRRRCSRSSRTRSRCPRGTDGHVQSTTARRRSTTWCSPAAADRRGSCTADAFVAAARGPRLSPMARRASEPGRAGRSCTPVRARGRHGHAGPTRATSSATASSGRR